MCWQHTSFKDSIQSRMIESFKDTSRELQSFLKNPRDKADSNQHISHKIKILLTLLALNLLLVFIFITPLDLLLEKTGWVDGENHAVDKYFNEFPGWVILLFGGWFVPFFEEVFFRTPLRIKRNYPLQIIIFSRIYGF